MKPDPLLRFRHERDAARDAQDPMASLCTVANVDEAGDAQLRSLVLRDVDDELAIFINASSPKWPHLTAKCALLTWWPSQQVQYRLHATTSPVPADIVAESWQLRPDMPKRMDWFYTLSSAQSSAWPDRQALVDAVQAIDLPEPLTAPDTARGLLLHVTTLERLDLNQGGGLHDRTRFTRTDATSVWQEETLVP